MALLEVWLYGTQMGVLEGGKRDFDFSVSPDAIARFGVLSTVMSQAIPLTIRSPRGRAEHRRNFFHELLPEGITRSSLAEQAKVDQGDTLGLLRRYGRDIAGALEIFDRDTPWEPATPRLRPLDESGIRHLAESYPTTPLGNDPSLGRTSLGGVQLKLALAKKAGKRWQPLGGHPSTHILKQSSQRYPTMIFDEEYGCRMGAELGLLDYEVSIEHFAGLPMLVVERYDRIDGRRLHQEDMNQALGASGSQKYQRYGGVVSLARIARILTGYGAEQSLQLLRLVTFAAALGNLDLHAKNISLLHPPDGTARLAPAYDNVPLLHQPTDGEVSLAIDRMYRLEDIRADNLVREAATWGLGDQTVLIGDTLAAVERFVTSQNPLPDAFPGLQEIIARNVRRLLS